MLNSPVAGFNMAVSEGSNVFSKIGTPSCKISNSVLVDLVPLIALYDNNDTESLALP